MTTFPYSVQDFLDAYKATGLTPVRGCTLDRGRHCGCPLGVLALHRFGEKAYGYGYSSSDHANLSDMSELLGLGAQETVEFAGAFDDGYMLSVHPHSPAVEMGVAVHKALGDVAYSSNYRP